MSAWKLLASSYSIVIVWFLYSTLPAPGLEIRGVGGGVIQTLRKGEGSGLQKSFFSPLRASVWPKNKVPPSPPEPLPWTRHCRIKIKG